LFDLILDNGQTIKQIVQYNFLAGVFNVEKGERGVHSTELSRHGDSYYKFDDENVREVGLDEIQEHPKLLFYKRSL